MPYTFRHKILIVDNTDRSKKIFSEIMKSKLFNVVIEASAQTALQRIKTGKSPFSVIFCEQNLPEIQGNLFLEKCLKIHPNTRLFLMADKADIKAIIQGVNRGSIHRYLEHPIKPDTAKKAVRIGAKMFELLQGNERLLRLAKKQNTKLYELGCDLMECRKEHEHTLSELDEEMKQVEGDIQRLNEKASLSISTYKEELSDFIAPDNQVDEKKIEQLLHETVKRLYHDFADLAQRNGFELSLTNQAGLSEEVADEK